MTGEQIGRAPLALDAVFCASVGVVGVLEQKRLGVLVGVRPRVIGLLGSGTVVWAGIVGHLSRSSDWTKSVGWVAGCKLPRFGAVGSTRASEDHGGGAFSS